MSTAAEQKEQGQEINRQIAIEFLIEVLCASQLIKSNGTQFEIDETQHISWQTIFMRKFISERKLKKTRNKTEEDEDEDKEEYT